ncbi:MAG: isopentenyl phosphate kinase family protein [Deltaproteobacteria bacterium]|nr:isopentenyl phosphate kinase family protein [Deltaproteobacteria bacterium]
MTKTNGITPRDELVFVKLGGSLITDKSTAYKARIDVIDRLSREIQRARTQRGLRLVVGHGSGGFAHVSATRFETARGAINPNSWEGFIRVHEDAAKLNAIVRESFAKTGVLAATIQPSSVCIARAGRIQEAYTRPIELLLEAGLIPLLYGDVCLDLERGMCVASTEEIFRYLAAVLGPHRVVLVGKVDGVLDHRGEVIARISSATFKCFSRSLLESDGVADVTGGMLHKVKSSLEMGVPARIINGLKPGLLERALLGETVPGTVVEG